MITTTIFTAFLRTLNSFTGLQCRNNYIAVRGQLCHSSAGYLIFMKCINYIWSKNCPSVLKLLIIKCFMQLYWKHLLHICVCDWLSRDTEVKINALKVLHFTVPGSQKVKQWAFGIFFHTCSYGHQYRSQIGNHFWRTAFNQAMRRVLT
jgi:hypothetical protein